MSEHQGQIESEFNSTWFKVVCSCGFESDPMPDEDQAAASLSSHYAEVSR